VKRNGDARSPSVTESEEKVEKRRREENMAGFWCREWARAPPYTHAARPETEVF
jgi:hypothetical protein